MNAMMKPALALAVVVGLAGPVAGAECPDEVVADVQAKQGAYVDAAHDVAMETFSHTKARAMTERYCLEAGGGFADCAAEMPVEVMNEAVRVLASTVEAYAGAVAAAAGLGCTAAEVYRR